MSDILAQLHQANARRWPNVALMLARRLRRRPTINHLIARAAYIRVFIFLNRHYVPLFEHNKDKM